MRWENGINQGIFEKKKLVQSRERKHINNTAYDWGFWVCIVGIPIRSKLFENIGDIVTLTLHCWAFCWSFE